jgi:ribonucleotide reductase alpha subunit
MSNGKLSDSAITVAENRYFMEGEDWESCANRVGRVIASSENSHMFEYASKFSEIIYDMDFLPGGRILRNAGRPAGSLFNCYHLPIGDSRKEIGKFYMDSLMLWGEGGGIGVNISSLRPKGDVIKTVGGRSSGPVSFLEASDAIAKCIESGGSRRAAALALMHITHPDVMRFIDAKIEHGMLPHYNISVAVTDEFLEAVESDGDWEFKFSHKSYGKVSAREIWDKIVSNMVKFAEPGILNWDKLIKNNSYYFDPVLGTNPCLVGNSMVCVADGRQYVNIKTLAEENKDVPVFCFNEITQKVEVQMMRRPRLTGKNKKILKIILNDGSIVRCTKNHKFYTKDGNTKRADELVSGDRLHHMVSYNASFEEVFKHSNSKSQDYRWINTGFSQSVVEHRPIAEFKFGHKLKSNEVVHHKNYNGLDNTFDNLTVMTKEDHDKLHSLDMFGDKNPMNRFPEKNWLIKQDHSGCNNGRYKGITPECVFNQAVEYSKELNRRVTQDEWCEYCLSNDMPFSLYSLGGYSCPSKMLLAAAKKAGVVALEYSSHIREYKKFLKLIEETDMDVFFDNGSIYVNKVCEWCGGSFITKWGNRERAFCSRKCSSNYGWSNEDGRNKFYSYYKNKQQKTRISQMGIYNILRKNLGRPPLKKEWVSLCRKEGISYRIRSSNESKFNEYCFTSYKDLQQSSELNFTVVSIEEDGYEDVYNGTVDGNHNFYIMVSEGETKSKKSKYNSVLCRQCGEAVLSPYDVCDLGSLVLTNFITGTVNTNWKKLGEVIKISVRFLDNVIDVNKYTLQETDIKAHNSRRTGLGVMGLAEYLFAKGLRYGSDKAIVETERLMRFIRDTVYETLVELAREKGAFPKFDPVPYGKASFIRKLPASLRMDIKEHGVRCVTGLAIAPTGTISLLAEVASGIEPLFRKAYLRHDRVSERMYVHPIYKKILENKEKIPEWYVDTDDLKPSDHFEIQSVVQKYVDGAVSKTINMPKGTTPEQLSKLTLEYIHDLKGVTVYVDGSREGQILNKVTKKEVEKYLKENKVKESVDIESVKCATGSCEM